jgi:hypothetical protein
LSSITLPDSLVKIGCLAFSNCYSLISINLPSTVTELDKLSWANCSSLLNISVDKDNPMYDSRDNCNAIIETATNTLIRGCKRTIIPKTVHQIGLRAFEGSKFSRYSGIFNLPNSLTYIDYGVFDNCEGLKAIRFDGTISQWSSIKKNEDWYLLSEVKTVFCIDGEVSIK